MYSRNWVSTGFVASHHWVVVGGTGKRMVQKGWQMSERDAARELREHRNDTDEWSKEAEEIEVKPRRSSTVSFRLSAEDFTALEQAMEQTGESLSEYIRKAIDLRIHGDALMPMLGILGLTYGSPHGSPYGDTVEVDPNQILKGHVAEVFGMKVIEGGSTSASYRPRHSWQDRLTATN